MSDGREERPQTKMFWSISTKTRTYMSVNTCNRSLLKLFKVPVAIPYD